MSSFQKATRRQAKLRAGICGPSGCGKSYSALLLARGIAGQDGRIAVVDTERGSASLYSHITEFDVAELTPPYSPARYIQLIKEAASSYDVLIIDSLTHAWAGEGGILEMHDNATKAERGGNSYTAWRNVTPQHNALVDAILNAPCHVIITMRTKTAYEMIDNGKGKKSPIKVGLAPIQRDGMEYEFTMVFDISVDGNIATASKDRTTLWRGRNEIISLSHGEELRGWLESGETPAIPQQPEPPASITASQHRALEARITELGLDRERVKNWLFRASRETVEHFPDMSPGLFDALWKKLPDMAATYQAERAAQGAPRHPSTLESAISSDEDPVFDALANEEFES